MSQINDFLDKKTVAPSAGKSQIDAFLDGAPPAEPGLIRSVGDSVLALSSGVTQGVKMLTDVAGADNAVSRGLGKATDALSNLESPYRKAEKQARAQTIKQADDSGSTWEQVKAYTGAFAEAPIDTTLNAVGTSAPTLAAGLLTGGGAAAGLAARAAQVGLGAAQGVGGIKGQIHESVKQKHLEAGATEADATQRADAAQAYSGQNAGSIALGGALGAVAGGTGAESAVRRLAGQRVAAGAADAAAPGIVRSAARGVAHEAPMEMLQGGQERYASNTALQGEGFDVPTWQGVAGQAALEGLASAPMGGGFGAIEGMARQGAQQQQGAGAAAFAAGEERTPPESIKSVVAKAQWVRGWDVGQAQASAAQASAPGADGGVPGAPGASSPETTDIDATVDAAQGSDAPADTAPSNWETGTSPLAQQIQSSVQNAQDLAAQVMKPSEQMGLDPSAGALSAVAVLAVDSGASGQMQAAAQEQESRAPAPAPAAGGADPETGEVAPVDRAQELQQRLEFIEQQARANGGWDMQLVTARGAARAELAALNPSSTSAQSSGARAAGGSSAGPAPARPAAAASSGAPDPAAASPGVSAGDQIAKLETTAANAQARAADWSSREYKPNSKPLPKYEAAGGPVDVQEANEQRRLKEVVSAKTAASNARAQAETLRQQGNVQAQLAAKEPRAVPSADEVGAKAIAKEGAARRLKKKEQADLQAELDAALSTGDEPGAPDNAFARASEDAGLIPQNVQIQAAAPAVAAPPGASKKGPANVAQAPQAQQAKAQQPQAGGAQTPRAAPAPGLNNASTTVNDGAQAAAPAGPQAQAPGGTRVSPVADAVAARRAQQRESSERWTRMTTAERQALAQRAPGLNAMAKKNAHTRAWGDLGPKVREQLAGAMESAAAPAAAPAIAGKDIDGDWTEFAKDSGTKAVPRAEMPQIKAAHRGAMTNFMNARGIAHREESVPADRLKPTQAEFSRKKVAQAKGRTEGDRSILVSRDGHVLDGHHQWLAAREQGDEVRVIRLDAPIEQLLDAAREFPSSSTSAGAAPASFRRSGQDDVEAEASVSGMTREQAEQLLRIMGQVPEISPAARAQAVSKVRATVDAIRGAWANGPDVVVAFDMNDPAVPADARAEDLKQRSGGAAGAPEGFYWEGKTYLLASQLQTPNDAARVLFHEALGHHGLRGAFGKDLDNILNQVETMRGPTVDAKIAEYGLRASSAADRRNAAEEVLAEMAQTTPQLHFVKRAIAAIRNWLRANVPGFRSLSMSDADIIQAFILPARRFVEQGARSQGGVPELAFSRGEQAPMRQAVTFSEARAAAKAFQGKPIANGQTGLEAVVSRNGLDKMLSSKAVGKSASAAAHSTAVANVDTLFQNALWGWSKTDRADNTNIAAIHRFFVPMEFEGRELMAKLTVKETVDANHSNPIYTVEAVDFNEKSPAAQWVDASAKADGLDLTSIRSAGDVLSLAEGIEQRNRGEGGTAMFSRGKLSQFKTKAVDQIHAALSHPGTVSIWDKTVGTMYHLAERAPAFKPVFQAAQQFVDDVSSLATDAADAAPRILPKLEHWADLKKQPIAAADNRAIARPIFEGTLMWGRDEKGQPALVDDLTKAATSLTPDDKAQLLLRTGKLDAGVLKMWRGLPVAQYENLINSRFESKHLKAGIVWTQKELETHFKLTPQQSALYREFRAGVDRSIDVTARADMLRVMGKEYAGLRDATLDAGTLQDALDLLTSTLLADAKASPDKSERLMQLHNQVVDRATQARDLQDAGYAPLSRFGRFTVDVVDPAGERLYFGMFETKLEANKMKEAMAREFKGATVEQGTMSQHAFKLFQGITPESLELFGNMLGLKSEGDGAQDKAFQEYLKLTKNNHSAMKRLMHRKGITGYSEDVGRVLASFIYSNARQSAAGLNMGDLDAAINSVPKDQGELKDVAIGLRDYIKNPQEEAQAVRGLLFAQYLGGSVASAIVNMSQPFAVTFPWLSQFGGARKAAQQLGRAFKDMGTKGLQYEPELARALKNAEDSGVVSPQEVHQLMAQARGSGSLRSGDGTKAGDARAALGNKLAQFSLVWGKGFSMAEQINRRSTFIAAFRTAKEQGMQDPAAFAAKAVLETQFLYSKANKMRWARGAVGGTLMTFKTYSIAYLELMQRMWTQGGPEGKKAVGMALVMLMLMGGAGGLPFAEDLEDVIDSVGQAMGYNISAKQWRKQAMREVLGESLAEFMESGVSGLPGSPVDVSGRLGMGNLIPGTGLMLTKRDSTRDLLEIVGPAGDFIKRGFAGAGMALGGVATGVQRALDGELGAAGGSVVSGVARGALEVAPGAVRNFAKGVDMAASGMYRDAKGYKVLDTTIAEALAKGIGFQPKSVAEVQEANSFMLRSKSFYTQNSSDIKAQWAKALFEKDESGLAQVRERLAAWNRNNPDQPIVVKMPDVWKKVREMGKDRTQRIADTAPKALRAQMRQEVAGLL